MNMTVRSLMIALRSFDPDMEVEVESGDSYCLPATGVVVGNYPKDSPPLHQRRRVVIRSNGTPDHMHDVEGLY